LNWTGGQPFLTQKLLKLISREPTSTLSATELVKQVLQNKIITHWESQDVPPHFKTVRARLTEGGNEQERGYLLSLYKQILLEGSIVTDESPEQMQLRLTGLVIKNDSQLTVYNPIYREVFDLNWVNEALEDLRPPLYAEALKAWQAHNKERPSFLLWGKALADVEKWAKDKRLSAEDNEFLQKCREKVLEDERKAREAAENANKILKVAVEGANEKAAFGLKLMNNAINQGRELSSSILLLLTLFALAMSVLYAKREVVLQEIKTDILQAESSYLKNNKLDALLQIVKTGKEFQQNAWFIQDKDTEASLLTNLQKYVYEIKEKNQFRGHERAINSVAFSSDGKTIASGSDDKKVKLWSLNSTQTQTLSSHNEDINSVVFSSDGKIIASGSDDKTVKLWSLDGKLLNTLEGHNESVKSVIFSQDRKTIVSSSLDNTIRFWSLEGKLLKTLPIKIQPISSLAFSPNGKTIAIASWNQTLELWSLEGKLLKTLPKQIQPISSLAFSPNGKTIISADLENNVKLWNLDGKLRRVFRAFSFYKYADIKSLALSQDEQTIAVAANMRSNNVGDKQIELWGLDIPSNKYKLLRTFAGMKSLAFSPVGKTIASGSHDNTVKLWSLDAKLPQTLVGMRSVAFSPNEETILSYSDNKTVQVWNRDGKLLKSFQWLNSKKLAISCVTFSPDGKTIVTGGNGEDNTVKLWNLDGKLLNTLTEHSKPVTSLAFSSDGKTIASGSRDNTVKLWNLDGKLLNTLTGHSKPVTSLAFSSDGKTFSSDGKTIASGSRDNTVKLWNLDGKLLNTLTGHSKQVISLAFSSDGKTIASGSRDNTVKLWNLDGKLLNTLTGHSKSVISLAFSSDGKTIVSASEDGAIKLSHLDLDNLLNNGCKQLNDYFSTHSSEHDRDICGVKGELTQSGE
jgi:WD40 repeat protein